MLSRIYRTAAAGAVFLLAAVGGVVLAAVSPAALVAVIAVGSIVGLITATHLAAPLPPSTRHHRGVGAATVTVAALLAMAGIAALLGAATAPVLLLLLVGGGAGLWRHRAAWRAYAIAHGVTPPGGPTAGRSSATPPAQAVGALSVRALCLAWQRTQCSLQSLPAGAARTELISTRQRLLDELEARDPVGFRRWLYRGVRASSDPGHYLTDNRTARTPRRNDSSAP